MSDMPVRMWCPTCEESSLDTGSPKCAWCGDRLQPPKYDGRSRQRRRHSKFTDAQIDQAYQSYLQGHSVRAIASVIWEKLGFKNAHTCANSLYYNLDAAGYKLRSKATVLRQRNYKHGMAARDNKNEYRKWRRRQNPVQMRPCKGVKLTYPQKGRPCQHYAMDGSDFCLAHDPARREQVVATVAKAREAAAA